IGVPFVEEKMSVGGLLRLFQDGVLERVAQPEGAETMVIVVHPLIDGGGLLADRLQGRMRPQQGGGRRISIVGNTADSHPPIVVRYILYQPIDRVPAISCLDSSLARGYGGISGEAEGALRLEPPPDVLYDEDVSVRGERLDAVGYGGECLGGNTVR